MNNRGFVLVIVVAMLGILAYIALDFAKVSRDTRSLSLNGLYMAKARLSSRSGLEKGLSFCDKFGNEVVPASFSHHWESAGDDINRSGDEDPGEDAAGDGFYLHVPLEQDRAPSLALEDPLAPGQALNQLVDGRNIGMSWNNGSLADQSVLLRISRPCLGLNAGIEAGRGSEGARFQADFGWVYSASDWHHPFNRPVVNMLNAWGNYHKYRAMVRSDKTYDFNLLIDDDRNLGDNTVGSPLYYQNPYQQFDRFIPSGNHPIAYAEIPLGDMMISQRPETGFKNLDDPVQILRQYISGWRDQSGTWMYADGGSIPLPSTEEMAAIEVEFRDLVSLDKGPDWEPVYRRGLPGPVAVPNHERGDENLFSQHAGRQLLNTRIYRVDGFRMDINTAPVSMLAAMIYSVTVDAVRRYTPDESHTAALGANATI
ncbi:MAG: hypothetical protein AB7F75_09705, partial [Planctomycetota bacterium]